MQSNRLDYRRSEVLGKPLSGKFLVTIVDSLVGGILRQVVEKMPDIVKQGCHHQVESCSAALGEHGSLQRMFQLRDCLTAVIFCAVFDKQAFDQICSLFNLESPYSDLTISSLPQIPITGKVGSGQKKGDQSTDHG